MVPRIGTEFAGYRIVALLGRGGMSVVYRAENPRLGMTVALKVLAPELADDEAFRERFVSESRLAAALNHPNIITIYDAGEADGALYLAMRFVTAPTSRLPSPRHGPLEPGRAVAILQQVASALDAAHAEGLIHRDVKPANILLDGGDGRTEVAYLADFGLTKARRFPDGAHRLGRLPRHDRLHGPGADRGQSARRAGGRVLRSAVSRSSASRGCRRSRGRRRPPSSGLTCRRSRRG